LFTVAAAVADDDDDDNDDDGDGTLCETQHYSDVQLNLINKHSSKSIRNLLKIRRNRCER